MIRQLQGGELGLTGKMKRSAILEKHAPCIASMFVHKSKHTYNSMCEASSAAIQDVKNHAAHPLLTQVILYFFAIFFLQFFLQFFTIFVYNFYLQVLITIFVYSFCLQFLFTTFHFCLLSFRLLRKRKEHHQEILYKKILQKDWKS